MVATTPATAEREEDEAPEGVGCSECRLCVPEMQAPQMEREMGAVGR